MNRRLPPHANLSWGADGAPRARDMDDVYYSVADGLAETQAVFLQGCNLPDAWEGRSDFTIGELGFGSGLNVLAVWELWRRTRPGPSSRLHIVSFEGRPMSAGEAAQAHAAWPEIADISEHLRRAWPVRARGVQRLTLDDGVDLTLFINEVDRALPQAAAACDAWFLDGFAPAKNPDMWTDDVFAHVARMTRAGGRVATYTVAGHVRRGLAAAGFDVEKRPGFGRKRERLEAVKPGPAQPAASNAPKRVVIVGAGVAGAACANAFNARGCDVVVVEHDAPASGASGNPRALVMPRLDASDTPIARALIAAYLAARRAYFQLPDEITETVDVRHLAASKQDRSRFDKLFADPPFPPDLFQPIDPSDVAAGAQHMSAVILDPPALIEHWLRGASLMRDRAVRLLPGDAPMVELQDGETLSADLVVLASGADMAELLGANAPPIEGRLGQIESAPAISAAPFAVAAGDYAIQSQGVFAFGATFEPYEGGGLQPSPSARAQNLDALAALHPEAAATLDTNDLTSRAGVRATTPDRLPLIGAAIDADAFRERHGDDLAHGRPIEPDTEKAANLKGVALAGGFGSRGFTWAPWAADILAAQAFGAPAAAERDVLEAVSPARFLTRALRRGD